MNFQILNEILIFMVKPLPVTLYLKSILNWKVVFTVSTYYRMKFYGPLVSNNTE